MSGRWRYESKIFLINGRRNFTNFSTGGRRIIYHKLVGDKLLRVVVENDLIITIYLTRKIQKYWKGEKG